MNSKAPISQLSAEPEPARKNTPLPSSRVDRFAAPLSLFRKRNSRVARTHTVFPLFSRSFPSWLVAGSEKRGKRSEWQNVRRAARRRFLLFLSLLEEEEEKEGEERISSRLPSFEGGGKRGGTRKRPGIFSVSKSSEQGSEGTLFRPSLWYNINHFGWFSQTIPANKGSN